MQTAAIELKNITKTFGSVVANKNVNLMLLRLSDFYRNFDGAEMSDEYTEKTKELIKIFQKLTGNTVTGETDKATWNLLSYLYLLLTEDKEH